MKSEGIDTSPATCLDVCDYRTKLCYSLLNGSVAGRTQNIQIAKRDSGKSRSKVLFVLLSQNEQLSF